MRLFCTTILAAAVVTAAVPAMAETLNLNVKVHATNLSPELTGVHVACSVYFDAARQQRYGPFPTFSNTVPRTAAGTADGTVTVTIANWVPEAKYWSCGLGSSYPGGGTSGFYLPKDQSYASSPQSRRASAGTLELNGTVP